MFDHTSVRNYPSRSHLNESTPFSLGEYNTVWKMPEYAPWGFETYADFTPSNTRNSSCVLPPMWDENGTEISITGTNGCLESDFDQYGDMEAFGVHPDWQRQLSKFASVQDRLREWKPTVMQKLTTFSCMAIKALDFDAIRIDKSTQVTVDALAQWTSTTRACANALGKNNFYITGEVTGGNTFGALYLYVYYFRFKLWVILTSLQWTGSNADAASSTKLDCDSIDVVE